ncbi:hypothetical protein HNR42_002241 [Deinobacterium chartae]|uniref:Uncharacterized protein n=1 Tax=Deinobacterium chartae TaxID=521158 RepID=A0A841I149_9DEIO|nr:hypothetical protein [Deinobacterium chartae]MBB6098806.1 hypothetical protein [Deinobacterium chartae]
MPDYEQLTHDVFDLIGQGRLEAALNRIVSYRDALTSAQRARSDF